MVKDLHVCTCIPNMGAWTNETGKSTALLFSYFALHQIKGVNRQKVTMLTAEGSMLAQNRHYLVRKALRDGTVTHVLFIDADMEFPMSTLHQLLAHKKPFVAANCTTRMKPILPVAFGLDGKRVYSKGKHGLQEVQHVGLAVALIETEILKRLSLPLFLQDWVPSAMDYCGEDVYLTQKLREHGVQILIDHDLSVQIKHVGKYAYGHDDITEVSNG